MRRSCIAFVLIVAAVAGAACTSPSEVGGKFRPALPAPASDVPRPRAGRPGVLTPGARARRLAAVVVAPRRPLVAFPSRWPMNARSRVLSRDVEHPVSQRDPRT